jgi:hypothetical protein
MAHLFSGENSMFFWFALSGVFLAMVTTSGFAAAEEEAAVVLAEDCSGTLQTLQPCLPAVEGFHPPKPTEACCDVIRNTDASCLCSVITKYSSYALLLNVDSALSLPKECSSSIPAGYTCDGKFPYNYYNQSSCLFKYANLIASLDMHQFVGAENCPRSQALVNNSHTCMLINLSKLLPL